MPVDHHPLAFEGAVDQPLQLVLGLCNAMGAHKSNIAIVVSKISQGDID